MNTIKRLCVYCGSSPGRNQAYLAAADQLAAVMVAADITLVYGGAGIGIMGRLADSVLAAGGEVIGVIPAALAHKEVAHPRLTELHVTDSMHERKMKMAELADAFIALPGGIGTLEELFEIWTWAQLGIHAKPCGLLNAEGYFDALIAFLDHMAEQQFVKPEHRAMLLVESNPGTLIELCVSYLPPPTSQWLKRNQT
ncbi:MAG: TIGR00730 family Rossman fold protein [Methylomonas sp.]|nr:TIGR00730 family Rossman fold protein [Methylomonas sp.]PPD20951.1 MAG: TIGR00730 family Rossman fold protein [Methylomonas sp.]PPD27197.1 MAG: TIGR00730 family Rossman fold protein [Methylomonas sp.]PPD39147.1 MAG: TIGR00730 family Rossman fold protein [Methylomonas sp.]PPD41306.1 MAG: TIGR00730 family Rossman fold protein [Methylomonas sp.]